MSRAHWIKSTRTETRTHTRARLLSPLGSMQPRWLLPLLPGHTYYLSISTATYTVCVLSSLSRYRSARRCARGAVPRRARTLGATAFSGFSSERASDVCKRREPLSLPRTPTRIYLAPSPRTRAPALDFPCLPARRQLACQRACQLACVRE